MHSTTSDTRNAALSPLQEDLTGEGGAELQVALYDLTRARKRVLLLLALVWGLTAFLFMLPSVIHAHEQLAPASIISHLGVALVGMAFSVILLLVIVKLRRFGRKVAVPGSFVAVVIAASLVAVSDIAFFDLVHALFGQQHAPHTSYMVKWTSNFAVFMSQFSVIAVTFWMLEMLEANRVSQLEIEQMRRLAAEAQNTANRARLFALRYQLNPHFLFNTLNSISSLVMTRRHKDAEEMLTRLSDFLRTTLTEDPERHQTLEGELETIDAYLGIERVRFGDRLSIDIDCPPELRDVPIPHFLLQPLVENAVKHGVAPCDRMVTISICARQRDDELVIAVENDCDGGEPGSRGTGVGLRNVRERLRAVYGEHGHLETISREAGYLALLRVPMAVPGA